MADEQFTDLTKIEIENAQALAALEQLSRAQQEVTANWQAMANAGTSALSAIEARLAGVTTSATTASVAIRALLADMQAMMAMGAGTGTTPLLGAGFNPAALLGAGAMPAGLLPFPNYANYTSFMPQFQDPRSIGLGAGGFMPAGLLGAGAAMPPRPPLPPTILGLGPGEEYQAWRESTSARPINPLPPYDVNQMRANMGAGVPPLSEQLRQQGVSAADLRAAGLAIDEETGGFIKLDKATQNVAGSTRGLYYESRGLMMGVLGLNLVLTEFSQTMGDKVDPQLKSVITGMESMSRFAMAGVSIGMLAGPGGAATGLIGGLALGTLTTVAAQLMSVSTEYQNLNNVLDKLAQKDDSALTLSTLFGWTQKDAQAALDAAKNNADLADSLSRVAQQQELIQKYNQGGFNQLGAGFQMGTQLLGAPGVMNPFASDAERTRAVQNFIEQQRLAFQVQPQILGGRNEAAQFMQPFQSLVSDTTAYANAQRSSEALSTLTGWQDKYSKNVLQMASIDSVFAKQLSENTVQMIAYAGSIDAAKKVGTDYSSIQEKMNQLAVQTQVQMGGATLRTAIGAAEVGPLIGPKFTGGLDVSKLSLQEYNQEMVLANQLANAQLAALTAAGIPTDDLTKKWDSTVRVMMLANGQIEVMTGKTAALSTVAEQLMNIYNKPTVQANPELNQITAPRLQNLLRGYETELSNLGVKQTPQEYLIFGQGGTLFRFITSSDAMTLATDKLREELAKNTDVLRGHYNIPTDFGYQPPTVWEYYAKTGSQQMGPVNYPWNFGTVDASGKPTLGHVPTGAATDMPTTLSLSNTLYGTFGANTQATSANTTALNQLTQKLGLNPELVYARSPIRPAEGKPTGFSHEIVGGGLGADMTGTYLPRMQGQDVFQVEGIPQVNSSLSGISLRMQSVVGNTDRLSMPAWTSVSLQAQMVGLLARMIPLLMAKQIINITMPPSGGGGGGGSSGFGTTSPATSAVGSGSAMVGASRVSSVRMA